MKVEGSDVVKEDDLEEETEPIEIQSTDNVGQPSEEINVEKLVSALQPEGFSLVPECEQSAKRRAEELVERKRVQQELEDFDDYDI